MGKRSVAALDAACPEKGPSKKRKADSRDGRAGAATAADAAPSSPSSQRPARKGNNAAKKPKVRGKPEDGEVVTKESSSSRSPRKRELVAETQEQQTNVNAEGEGEERERADERVCGSRADDETAKPGGQGVVDASNGNALPKKPKKSKGKKLRGEEIVTRDNEAETADPSSKDVPATSVQSQTAAALLYLRKFVDDRSSWKFQKLKQVWLLRNWHDPTCLSDEDAKRFLAYIEGLKGAQREQLLREAKKISQEELPETEIVTDAHNHAESSTGERSSEQQLSNDERRVRRRRAKKVVKVLSRP